MLRFLLVVLSLASRASAQACPEADVDPALDAFQRLALRIRGLEPESSTVDLVAELDRMRELPCFSALRESDRVYATPYPLALRDFWLRGGEMWVGMMPGSGDTVLRPPSMRTTLDASAMAGDPLAAFVCAIGDAACSRPSRAYVLRAEQQLPEGETDLGLQDHAIQHCAQTGSSLGPELRYAAFVECIEAARPTTTMVPMGALRVPDSGWLVLRGRRGHYQFCDEIRAYDLGTGAAYVAQSCSGLIFEAGDGLVDDAAVDSQRHPHVAVGTVAVEPLREAAWMMLISRVLDRDAHRRHDDAVIPPGVRRRPLPFPVGLSHHVGGFRTSEQTRLDYAIHDGRAALVDGAFTWPYSTDRGDMLVVRLVQVAEATFEPECPGAHLPSRVPSSGGRIAVSPIDGAVGSLATTSDSLEHALTGVGGLSCRALRRRGVLVPTR